MGIWFSRKYFQKITNSQSLNNFNLLYHSILLSWIEWFMHVNLWKFKSDRVIVAIALSQIFGAIDLNKQQAYTGAKVLFHCISIHYHLVNLFIPLVFQCFDGLFWIPFLEWKQQNLPNSSEATVSVLREG